MRCSIDDEVRYLPTQSPLCIAPRPGQARWVGRIEASDADEAIQAAAVTSGANIRKLIAMRRREIA
jgi:hypothetical protein